MHRALGAMGQLTELLVGAPDRAPAHANTTEAYLHLAIQAVLQPNELAQVPVAKILKFRERHTAELGAFREHVASLGEELRRVAAVENLEVANAHLTALYEQQTKPKLDELRRALRGFGIESVAGAMALKVNAAGNTVVASIAALGGQPALAGSPVAYLLAAERKLTGDKLLRAMRP